MARFEDTPEHRRNARGDPVAGRLVYPASERQLRFLRALCREAGVEYVRPGSADEARSRITRLRRTSG